MGVTNASVINEEFEHAIDIGQFEQRFEVAICNERNYFYATRTKTKIKRVNKRDSSFISNIAYYECPTGSSFWMDTVVMNRLQEYSRVVSGYVRQHFTDHKVI